LLVITKLEENRMDIKQKAMMLPASKTAAREALEGIIQRVQDTTATVSEDELAVLWAYFGGRKRGKASPFAWLRKAANPKAAWPPCRYIHAFDGWIVGADDCRIHAIRNKGANALKPDVYDPKTMSPVFTPKDLPTDSLDSLRRYVEGPSGPSLTVPLEELEDMLTPHPDTDVFAINGVDFGVKRNYLDDALSIMDREKTVVHYTLDSGVPIRITDGDHLAVVMGYRL
jgi:hypothetical protein